MEVHFLMSKLTREEKIEIYNERKQGTTVIQLSIKYKVRKEVIEYLIRLIDMHGFDILRKDRNRYYSPTLKQEIINRVFIDHQSINSTALEYGLSSKGILQNWIKSYKENNYAIVEKEKGRPSTMKKENSIKKYEDMTPEEKIKYLENKNLDLEVENAYLKKLRAVIQNKKSQQKKK